MRILHTMIRVGDLQRSIDFYTQVLGMRVLRKTDYPGGRFTNVFVGYGSEDTDAVIELTYNWDTHSYDIGNGFGHIALGVPDVVRPDDHGPKLAGSAAVAPGCSLFHSHVASPARRAPAAPG